MTHKNATVKRRLGIAMRRLELVAAALQVEADYRSDGQHLMRAALEATEQASEELYWLAQLPAEFQDTDCPTSTGRASLASNTRRQ